MPTLTLPVRRHFGVYGVFLRDGNMLVIRKSRGPYTGCLDLPGGTPDPGETREQTLVRELREETGGEVASAGPWREFDVNVRRTSTGKPIDFRHSGAWCEVSLQDVDLDLPPDEDVAECLWMPLAGWRRRDDLSSALRSVLAAL